MSTVKNIDKGIRKEKCLITKRPTFNLLPHQKKVRNYFINSPYRGLLLYHKLGSGKTCTSISISDELLKLRKIEKVYVCTPGSLRKNFVTEYCRKCGIDQTYLDKYYTFITYNTDIFDSIKKLDFNDSLVIIDEAHNLINGAKNISKNPNSLYNQILNSNARVLILTATVIFNNPVEWFILGNLLKNNTFPNIIEGDKLNKSILFDENALNDENMKGIISYFPGYESDFPEVIYHKPIKVLLPIQYSHILSDIIFKENKQISILKEKERRMGLTPHEKRELIMLLKRIRSRSFSNINYSTLYLKSHINYINYINEEKNQLILFELKKKLDLTNKIKDYNAPHIIIKKIDDFIGKVDPMKQLNILKKLKENIVYDIVENCEKKCTKKYIREELNKKNIEINEVELNHILNNIEDIEILDYPIEKGGWLSHAILKNKILNYACPKIVAIIINILKNINTKQVIFSYFIKRGGLLFINTILNMCGIKSEIYSGEVTAEKRSRILDTFNSVENRNGKIIKVLLTTEAGCEGITMLEVEHVHILETNPNTNKTLQCIGRAARFKSHSLLPKNRRKVNIWKYYATIVTKSVRKSTDPEIDLTFLNSFEDYYNYYIGGDNLKLIDEIYGKTDKVMVYLGGGIDESLDDRSKENINEYDKFYNILQKHSIENTGLI